MNNFEIYIINCITNMHVGSGDSTYSIIDNQVQRDAITNFPIINSSSLKGSLKEYLKNELKKDNEDKDIIEGMFGSGEKGKGKCSIFQGMLLSIPVRGLEKPFFRATCPRIIKDFKSFIDNFHFEAKLELNDIIEKLDDNKNSSIIFGDEGVNELNIEEFNVKVKYITNKGIDVNKLEEIFGQELIILDDSTFSKIISELPIIARNKLDNGESKNLWYEEIVPRETRFYFGVINEMDKKDSFSKIEEESVQIGGNATIGYGYCNIKKMSR